MCVGDCQVLEAHLGGTAEPFVGCVSVWVCECVGVGWLVSD